MNKMTFVLAVAAASIPPLSSSLATSIPTPIQHVSTGSNTVGQYSIGNPSYPGNPFNVQFPNPVGAGNCVILCIANPYSSRRTITITDGKNTWPSRSYGIQRSHAERHSCSESDADTNTSTDTNTNINTNTSPPSRELATLQVFRTSDHGRLCRHWSLDISAFNAVAVPVFSKKHVGYLPFSSSPRFSWNAALMSAMWVKACGKLPKCSPEGPSSSG